MSHRMALLVGVAFSVFFTLAGARSVSAQTPTTYTVPITHGTTSYTLTVVVDGARIAVTASSPTVKVGRVTKAQPAAGVSPGAESESQIANAVTIPYDDLLRYNEDHVGKVVRYVGEVAEYQETTCLLCTEPSYMLRVNVTPGSYGLWDDAIWVDYKGADRFLEDDIVTVWGKVTGLKSYTAVLGNTITVPQIEAIAVKLGEVANPSAAASASHGSQSGTSASGNANLRNGPGTNYPIVGSVTEGQALVPVARNADSSWYKLDSGAWIASFLLRNPPGGLPVESSIPAPVATDPAPVDQAAVTLPTPTPAPAPSKSMYAIGEQIEAGGWSFKVSEVHKRKAIYLYDEKDVAMGNFLVIILEATNHQSGSDYFDANLDPWVTDNPGNTYGQDGATGYATWQYGGLGTIYSDVDPGEFIKIVSAYDLPPETGHVMLSLEGPLSIDLGDFASMPLDD